MPGVKRIHDLHVWGLTPSQWVLTAHVVIGKSELSDNHKNSDTENHNVDEVLREAINALKNDSRFLSITIQPESHDEKTPVMQPVRIFGYSKFNSKLKCHYMDLPNYSEAVDMPVPGMDELLLLTNSFVLQGVEAFFGELHS